MRLPGYPKYKPSGVEWLGNVPQHWELKRLKIATQLADRKVEADEENPLPYIGMENIESWTGRLLPLNSDIVPTGTANQFHRGSTLFGKLRPYLAKACCPSFDGLCSTEMIVLNSTHFDRYALLYVLLTDGFIKLVDSSTFGSKMPRASWDFIGACILPIAPLAEQHSIVNFLHHKNGQIDTLIRKKEELIQNLQEKRSALISRTVTRGLPSEAANAAGFDPHPKMKDSGIEWIGKIPEHWQGPMKLSRAAAPQRHSFVNGPFGSDLLTSELTEEGVPVIYIRDISLKGYERASESCVSTEKAEQIDFCRVDPGDIVIAKVGDPPGTAAIYPIEEPAGIVTQDVIRIRVDPERVSSAFLTYFLNSTAGRGLIDNIAIESTRMRVSLGDYKNSLCVLPPLSEQRETAKFLDRETRKIDTLEESVEQAIGCLREYRSALITSAITGKIDVRNYTEG